MGHRRGGRHVGGVLPDTGRAAAACPQPRAAAGRVPETPARRRVRTGVGRDPQADTSRPMSTPLICAALGVRPHDWPPDHYALLGLSAGEVNAAEVEARVL